MSTYTQDGSARRRSARGKLESRIRLTVYVRFGGKFSETWHGDMPRRTVLTLQGVQFTALEFTACLEAAGVRISMDGHGRALDNIFVERLWRTVKYEDIYLKDYAAVPELDSGLESYFQFYNHERVRHEARYVHGARAPTASCGAVSLSP